MRDDKFFVKGMSHITLSVKNIHRSFQFYKEVIRLKPLVRWDKGAYFLVGDFWFCLNVDETHSPQCGYTHYAFEVSEESFSNIRKQIVNSRAVVFKDNTSPGESMYFLDPDGHKLEIHVGNWRDRVEVKKANKGSWKDVEWFI